MLIRSPCKLGEKFTSHRGWGNNGEAFFLTGIGLFYWSCGFFEGTTLYGGRRAGKCGYDDKIFEPRDTNGEKICFDVPSDMIVNGKGVPLSVLGIKGEKTAWISGLYLKDKEHEWFFRIRIGDRGSMEMRTPELDELFAPLLPAVNLRLTEFL